MGNFGGILEGRFTAEAWRRGEPRRLASRQNHWEWRNSKKERNSAHALGLGLEFILVIDALGEMPI
jgi:hypothetical protein